MKYRKVLLALLAGVALLLIGCDNSFSSSSKSSAAEKVFIEAAKWERRDGHNLHEFTIVNANDIVVKNIVLKFSFLDLNGNVVEEVTQTFRSPINSHDSIRKINVDTGPTNNRAFNVKYEVVKVRTVFRRTMN